VQEHGVLQLLNLLAMNYINLYNLFEMKVTYIQQKLATFSYILGILNNSFEPTLLQTFSRIKVYNALAVPIVLYGSEIWTLRNKDKKRLTSIEMKVFRKTAGYALF
jgi:hypothetical protein